MTASDDFSKQNSLASLTASGANSASLSGEKTEADKGLLPAGLSDLLAPQAEQMPFNEAVLSCFSQFGYQRIKPPLLEFETSLLADGPGAALADQTFRLLILSHAG